MVMLASHKCHERLIFQNIQKNSYNLTAKDPLTGVKSGSPALQAVPYCLETTKETIFHSFITAKPTTKKWTEGFGHFPKEEYKWPTST